MSAGTDYNQKVRRTHAGVSELADDRDSKSCGEIRVGSSPTTGTM